MRIELRNYEWSWLGMHACGTDPSSLLVDGPRAGLGGSRRASPDQGAEECWYRLAGRMQWGGAGIRSREGAVVHCRN